jgi:hypothetical protein
VEYAEQSVAGESSLKQEIFIPIKVIKRGSAKSKIVAPDDVISKPSLNQPLKLSSRLINGSRK